MTDRDDNKKASLKIKTFKFANNLKMKLGRSPGDDVPGRLAPDLVDEAEALIHEACKGCEATIGIHLDDLTAKWGKMRDMPQSDERAEIGLQIFTLAHEIKDIGSMCGYDLAAHFAESLRDYIVKTELQVDAQRVIIQALTDALNVVHKQGIKDDGGPVADELKAVVKVAIDKYS